MASPSAYAPTYRAGSFHNSFLGSTRNSSAALRRVSSTLGVSPWRARILFKE